MKDITFRYGRMSFFFFFLSLALSLDAGGTYPYFAAS